MGNTEKLRRAVWYAMTSPELPADARSALQEMFNPTNLGIVAGVLAAWAGAHFFGLGEVADIVVAGVVYASLGGQAIQGLIEIAEFAREVIAATTELQLRRASTRLTRAITILGVDTAMAVLLRGARVVSRPVMRRTTPNALGEAPKPSTRGSAISDVAPAAPLPQLRQGARTIWDDIKATDSALPGTSIPKSFELATSKGSFWVHPNATKHMGEYLTRDGLSHGTSMSSQSMLTSLQGAVEAAARQGIESGRMMQVGRWELIFSQRAGDVLPVLKHALFR